MTEDDVDGINENSDQRVTTTVYYILFSWKVLLFIESSRGAKTFVHYCILQLLNDLLSLIQEASSAPRLDFTDPSLINEDYLTWTGWNQEQFENMFNLVSPHILTTCNCEARNTLAIFWIKLKANLSFRQMGSLFNIPGDEENRRKLAARSFDSVRQVLLDKLVPKYIRNQSSATFWSNPTQYFAFQRVLCKECDSHLGRYLFLHWKS